MSAIWISSYLLVGFVLTLLMLAIKPAGQDDGGYEGFAAATFFFWPLTILLVLPFVIAYACGWWEIPDD